MDEEGNALGSNSSTEMATAEAEGAATNGVKATDAARRRASELGLRLSDVKGTGSGGRILIKDVENAERNGG
jgi:pyruvate/2-oxoglutarate dehydrogenase complex dihydrolipoamide acyltransferase (E2) component